MAEGLSHRKGIALFAVLTVSNLVDSPMLKLNAIARKISLKHEMGGNKKLAKKTIKKPKLSTKKSIKEKAKPTLKSKNKNIKEIKSEKPNTKIELTQDV